LLTYDTRLQHVAKLLPQSYLIFKLLHEFFVWWSNLRPSLVVL